jgi:hypothetical protein
MKSTANGVPIHSPPDKLSKQKIITNSSFHFLGFSANHGFLNALFHPFENVL